MPGGATRNDWLIESGINQETLDTCGAAALIPNQLDKDDLMWRVIAFKNQAAARRLSRMLHRLLEKMRESRAEGVILGCTELPVVLASESRPLPTIDPLEMLVLAAVREALEIE